MCNHGKWGDPRKKQQAEVEHHELDIVGARRQQRLYAICAMAPILYQEQGYVLIAEKRLHQDNQSTMKMLKNGKLSCGGQSRHVY